MTGPLAPSRPAAKSTAARRCGFDRVDTITFGALKIDEFDHWVHTRIHAATISDVSPAAALMVPRHELARIAVEADGSLREAGDLLHIWIAERLATATGVRRIGDGVVKEAG